MCGGKGGDKRGRHDPQAYNTPTHNGHRAMPSCLYNLMIETGQSLRKSPTLGTTRCLERPLSLLQGRRRERGRAADTNRPCQPHGLANLNPHAHHFKKNQPTAPPPLPDRARRVTQKGPECPPNRCNKTQVEQWDGRDLGPGGGEAWEKRASSTQTADLNGGQVTHQSPHQVGSHCQHPQSVRAVPHGGGGDTRHNHTVGTLQFSHPSHAHTPPTKGKTPAPHSTGHLSQPTKPKP